MTEQDDLYADLPRICSQDTLMGVLAHQLCLQSAVNLDNMQLATTTNIPCAASVSTSRSSSVMENTSDVPVTVA
jgi:hypothetical protein